MARSPSRSAVTEQLLCSVDIPSPAGREPSLHINSEGKADSSFINLFPSLFLSYAERLLVAEQSFAFIYRYNL